MEIRKVQPGDYPAIEQLVETAFETAEISSGTEQEFVRNLRAGDTFLPKLEFVAEENGKLLGHIMLTEQKVNLEQGELKSVLVAPLCVALESRGCGIGEKLLSAACEEAKAAGYKAAFLVGNPKYYGRFGFVRTIDLGIRNTSGILNDVVLGKELESGVLRGVSGTIDIV